jgi:hypothetical protein
VEDKSRVEWRKVQGSSAFNHCLHLTHRAVSPAVTTSLHTCCCLHSTQLARSISKSFNINSPRASITLPLTLNPKRSHPHLHSPRTASYQFIIQSSRRNNIVPPAIEPHTRASLVSLQKATNSGVFLLRTKCDRYDVEHYISIYQRFFLSLSFYPKTEHKAAS